MPTSIRVTEEAYKIFDSIKKALEKKAQGTADIRPRYSQSDVIKHLCNHYLQTSEEKTT